VPLINDYLRGRTVAACAGALAAVALTMSAVATADPDPGPDPGPPTPVADPQAQCASPEVGGVYKTDPATGDHVTHTECQYIVEGHFYYDNYADGVYTGTLVYRDGAKVPTERPQLPELLTIPPGLPEVLPFPGLSDAS
jgi:hypothetical protein